jgi:hypothetical protein
MDKRNPFPGMNPYMQLTWPDVHVALIAYIREALGTELPEDLLAKGEMAVEVFGDSRFRARPDVAVVGEEWKNGLPPVWTPAPEYQGLIVSEPTLVTIDLPRQRWVEVRSDEGELITVIEVISPSNKRQGRGTYEIKRDSFVAAGVNVVEIDLVRGGERVVDAGPLEEVSALRDRCGDYLVSVSRGSVPGRREIYPCPMRERLPVIRLPLRAGEPDIPLDIQALVDRCYTSGRYWKLDYSKELDPPLSEEDKAWADDLLREAGVIV